MTAQQMIVDTIANNLANMNTVGFKIMSSRFRWKTRLRPMLGSIIT